MPDKVSQSPTGGRSAFGRASAVACMFGTMMPVFVAALGGSCGGGKDAAPSSPTAPTPVLTTVMVTLSVTSIEVGQSATASASGVDQDGRSISTGAVTWSSSAPSVATVSAIGTVTGMGAGSAMVTAAVNGKAGSATLAVRSVGTVRSISLDYPTATLARGQLLALKPTLRDSTGGAVIKPGVRWASADSTIVRVDTTGTLTAVASGFAVITASLDGTSATSAVTVISFVSIKAGTNASCALTATGVAYCAGAMFGSQAIRPPGDVRFSSLESDGEALCGLAVAKAYCWGANAFGQLGVGDSTSRGEPTPVAGNLSFAQLSVGEYHACGLTQAGDAYCWGGNGMVADFNTRGALGVGDTLNRYAPTAVQGGLKFKQIEAGGGTTCAVTLAGDAYCWGRNELGAVGNGSSFGHLGDYIAFPVKVAGNLQWKQVVTKGPRSCGLTVAGKAYCWGNNTVYETGSAQSSDICYGGKPCNSTPVPVETIEAFSLLSTSQFATCGLTASQTTSCWGLNYQYLFGRTDAPTCPTAGAKYGCTAAPISGPAHMATLSGARENFCGIGSDGIAYCWGGNDSGQRGWPGSTPDATPRPFSIAPESPPPRGNLNRAAARP